jgi:hypothetical protein
MAPQQIFGLPSARQVILRRTAAGNVAIGIELVIARQIVGHVESSDSFRIEKVVGRGPIRAFANTTA